MNYVKEMTGFYDWLELNDLSPSAINLWYALMHINHKTGWLETFTVAESVLCIKTHLTDRTLRKARAELKEKGRIDFLSRKGKAPAYRIIPFHSYNEPSDPFQTLEKEADVYKRTENFSVHLAEDCAATCTADRTEVGSALVKQQKINKQTKATWSDVIDAWRSVFGFDVKPNHAQMLGAFIDEDRMSESLVLEAIERVKLAAKPALSYLWKILSNWAKAGIQTIQDLVSHEKKRNGYRPEPAGRKRELGGRDIPNEVVIDYSAGEDWL